MKFKFTSLLVLIIAVLCAGCLKNSSPATPNALNVPSGNFTGQFQLIRQHTATKKYDTTYANCRLVLNPDMSFILTGDTTTVMAAGQGTFGLDQSSGLMFFTDQTAPKNYTLNSPKKHLTGTFLYNYSGVNLTIGGASDTLSLVYTLIRN